MGTSVASDQALTVYTPFFIVPDTAVTPVAVPPPLPPPVLTDEQAHALEVITGPERAAVLVGPAGTGKGVVIDAAARAEQLTGNATFGVAVSGSTAQRLGHDSPALAGRTLTLDALVARARNGRLDIDAGTTIFLDEAGI